MSFFSVCLFKKLDNYLQVIHTILFVRVAIFRLFIFLKSGKKYCPFQKVAQVTFGKKSMQSDLVSHGKKVQKVAFKSERVLPTSVRNTFKQLIANWAFQYICKEYEMLKNIIMIKIQELVHSKFYDINHTKLNIRNKKLSVVSIIKNQANCK